MFPCIGNLRLADSNLVGMEKLYYYSIRTKMYIKNSCSTLEVKDIP